MRIHQDLADTIGNTPLLKLKKASEMTGCTILGKAEFMNPGQSVKDRAALSMVEAAERGRSRFVALADRVARAYAPVVHATALLTFLGWFLLGGLAWDRALLVATAVLIITCPCALALAVPVVQVVASTRLLRSGVLLLSPTALERLAQIDHVVFDKTGTLTLGRPELVEAPEDPEVRRRAASLAAASSVTGTQATPSRQPSTWATNIGHQTSHHTLASGFCPIQIRLTMTSSMLANSAA